MKVTFTLLALAAIVAVTFASEAAYDNNKVGYGRGYGYGDPETRVYNAKRQLYVNNVARHVGSGVGTADYDGVPGTYFGRDRGYAYAGNYGYGGYGDGYGYGGYRGGYRGDNYYY